jgi:hypothetical protein
MWDAWLDEHVVTVLAPSADVPAVDEDQSDPLPNAG